MSIKKTFPGRVPLTKTHLGPTDIIGADSVAIEQERNFYRLLPVAAHTLRFEFGDPTYDPTEHWEGRAGLWSRVGASKLNIWEWFNEATTWPTAFGGTTADPISPFMDVVKNPVRLLAAGATGDVTDFSRCFQYARGLVEVCPIDTRNATTTFCMFSQCWNVEYYPDFDLSSVNDCRAMFQVCWSLKRTPRLTLPTDHTVSLQNMFTLCNALEEITLFDTSMVTSMENMFESDGGTMTANTDDLLSQLNIPFVDDWVPGGTKKFLARPRPFGKFKTCPAFDTSKVTNMSRMFAGTSIEKIPNFNWASVTNTSSMFESCFNLRGDFNLVLPSATNVSYMFGSIIWPITVNIVTDSACDFHACFDCSPTTSNYHRGQYKPRRSALKKFSTNYANVSNAKDLFKYSEIIGLPDLTGIPSTTDVRGMFNECRDAKYGILEAYNLLSTQGNPHDANTFKNCGIDTEEGRAQLEQIPASWGGLMAD